MPAALNCDDVVIDSATWILATVGGFRPEVEVGVILRRTLTRLLSSDNSPSPAYAPGDTHRCIDS